MSEATILVVDHGAPHRELPETAPGTEGSTAIAAGSARGALYVLHHEVRSGFWDAEPVQVFRRLWAEGALHRDRVPPLAGPNPLRANRDRSARGTRGRAPAAVPQPRTRQTHPVHDTPEAAG